MFTSNYLNPSTQEILSGENEFTPQWPSAESSSRRKIFSLGGVNIKKKHFGGG